MPRRKEITAGELMAELEANPEWVEKRRQREEARRHRRQFRRRAEEPLVRDLRIAGSQVDSVWDLVGTREPYPQAIPILLDHLEEEYPAKIKEGIARSLAVRVLSPEHWQVILRHFIDEVEPETKFALALVLKANARPEHVTVLEGLVMDPRSGKGRVILAQGLYDLKGDDAKSELKSILEPLVSDPEIGESIAKLLKTGSTLFK